MWIPILELIRLEESQAGTFGVLRVNKEVFCLTLEPRDELNAPTRSSIPAQQYLCRRVESPKFGETFEVTDVPGRSHVLFHAGNVAHDTQGCILLGATWGKLKENRAVLNSGDTFRRFLDLLANHGEAHLTIREEY